MLQNCDHLITDTPAACRRVPASAQTAIQCPILIDRGQKGHKNGKLNGHFAEDFHSVLVSKHQILVVSRIWMQYLVWRPSASPGGRQAGGGGAGRRPLRCLRCGPRAPGCCWAAPRSPPRARGAAADTENPPGPATKTWSFKYYDYLISTPSNIDNDGLVSNEFRNLCLIVYVYIIICLISLSTTSECWPLVVMFFA